MVGDLDQMDLYRSALQISENESMTVACVGDFWQSETYRMYLSMLRN